MNFSEVLNALTADCSGYAAAKKLGITPTSFYRYQNGKKHPSDDVLERIADITGLPLEQVFFAAYAEKVHNPKVAEAFRNAAA